MLSRHTLLKGSLKPALNCIKVDNAAHIHVGCSHKLKLVLPTSKYLKNYRRNVFSTGLQVRYESLNHFSTSETTNESTTSINHVPELPVIDPIPEPPVVLSEIPTIQSTAEILTSEPTFASLGLGGWTPVGMVQRSLEFFHVGCGLPWWEAVVLGTVVIRLLMFPLVVISQKNVAILNNNLPQIQHLQLKVSEARQRGDRLEAAKYSAELMKYMQEKNFNPVKNMLPSICQAPVFISAFLGLRGMSNLPVQSLKTGGTLWFTDLTIPDQFYILPLITSATLFCTLKLGVDTAQSSQNMLIMKYVAMVMPLILLPFSIKFPGLILVYWTTTNFISLLQVGFLRIPKVRDYFKIEKLVKHQKQTLPLKDKGFINNVKDSWTNMKITSELDQRERADKMNFMKAGRDPIRKTYKVDPTKAKESIPALTALQHKKRFG